MTTTVRLPEDVKKELATLAAKVGLSQQAVLVAAIEEYKRKLHWEQFCEAFSELRSDAESWEQEGAERALWDATLKDGLE